MLKPVFEELKKDFPEAEFIDIDIDENSKETSENNVRSVPTIIIKSGDEEVERLVGAKPKVYIKQKIEEHYKG